MHIHIDSLQGLIDRHALNLSHRLQAHVFGNSLDQGIADHFPIRQPLESGDRPMLNGLLDLVARGRRLSVDFLMNLCFNSTS